jgi:hypothetical protein
MTKRKRTRRARQAGGDSIIVWNVAGHLRDYTELHARNGHSLLYIHGKWSSAHCCRFLLDCTATAGTYIALQPLCTYRNLQPRNVQF